MKVTRGTLKIIAVIVVVFLALGFLARSCSKRKSHPENYFSIAVDPTWYPLDFMGKERNMIAFVSDLLTEIAVSEHVQFHLFTTSRDDLFSGLSRGEFDAIITSSNPDPLLESKNEFSDPFYLTGPVIVVEKKSDIRSFADLGGEMVGIKTGSPIVFRIRDYPAILFRTYPTLREALDNLMDDQIDAVIMDSLPAYGNTETYYTEKLKVVGRPLTDEGLRLMARKDSNSAALIMHFDKGLKDAINNGTYKELAKKWGIYDTLEMKDPSSQK